MPTKRRITMGRLLISTTKTRRHQGLARRFALNSSWCLGVLVVLLRLAAHEQRQHARLAVKPVVRDLAVAEEADQREIAEHLADEAELLGIVAEEVGAARNAAEIEPTPWRCSAGALFQP